MTEKRIEELKRLIEKKLEEGKKQKEQRIEERFGLKGYQFSEEEFHQLTEI